MESCRADRSGSPSVTSVKVKSCSSFKACDGRNSTAMGRPGRFGTELFQKPEAASTAIPLPQQRIERTGDLALAAVRPRRLRARCPGVDVEMRPGLRRADEAIEEQRGGDRAGEAAADIVDVRGFRF